MKQSQEIVSAVGETNILIIVGTPGQGPRTFSVAKFDRSHIRNCTYQISKHRTQKTTITRELNMYR